MKYNPELERVTKKWIEEVLGVTFPPNESLISLLKPGVVLCKLVNALNLCNVTVPKIYEVSLSVCMRLSIVNIRY